MVSGFSDFEIETDVCDESVGVLESWQAVWLSAQPLPRSEARYGAESASLFKVLEMLPDLPIELSELLFAVLQQASGNVLGSCAIFDDTGIVAMVSETFRLKASSCWTAVSVCVFGKYGLSCMVAAYNAMPLASSLFVLDSRLSDLRKSFAGPGGADTTLYPAASAWFAQLSQ